MHTFPPPSEALDEWLEEYSTTNGNFGHLLLLQTNNDNEAVSRALSPYFESAHLDAREVFHADIGIDLHPDADVEDDPVIVYPNSLPSTTQRGLFGEVMAGLVSENYELVGNHDWNIPIFLFRGHQDACNYLFDLVRNPERTRQTIGRLGSDFIGLELDDVGSVIRFISGEAKWRLTLTPGTVDTLMLGDWKKRKTADEERVRNGKGVWNGLNNEPNVPIGLRDLQRLLQENDPEGYDTAILSMDRALVLRNPEQIPKTDLVIVVGNGSARRKKMDCLLPYEDTPPEYTAGNDLQLVEVILQEGDQLIDALYQSLWSDDEEDNA